jgi:hypothetical protein
MGKSSAQFVRDFVLSIRVHLLRDFIWLTLGWELLHGEDFYCYEG